MKRFLSVVLVVVLTASLLTGCESNEKKMEALMGKWEFHTTMSAEAAETCLKNINFSEEQIALVDLNTFAIYSFCEYGDGTYRTWIDPEVMREAVKDFLEGAFDDLYEGRAELDAIYGTNFVEMSKGELQQIFAELYGKTNYTDMIDFLCDACYNYEVLNDSVQTGTYRVDGDKIWRTITGETEEEYITYKIEGDTLTLIYVDGEEVFVRTK